MPNEPAWDLLEDCHSFPRCRTGWRISPAVDYAKDIYSRLGVMRDSAHSAIGSANELSQIRDGKDYLGNSSAPETFSYAGSDILCTMYVPSHTSESSTDPGFIEVEDQLQTITVSSARSVMPVRRLGETNPAAYARGSRTIAGSMVFTTGLKDAFVKMLAKSFKDGEPRNEATLFVDQIPKFSMIFDCHNELGGASSAMLVNITLTNFGTTFSVDDIYTESTFTYVAEQYFPITNHGDRKWISTRLSKIVGQVFEESIESLMAAGNSALNSAREEYSRRQFDVDKYDALHSPYREEMGREGVRQRIARLDWEEAYREEQEAMRAFLGESPSRHGSIDLRAYQRDLDRRWRGLRRRREPEGPLRHWFRSSSYR